jgi:hypothetical protein
MVNVAIRVPGPPLHDVNHAPHSPAPPSPRRYGVTSPDRRHRRRNSSVAVKQAEAQAAAVAANRPVFDSCQGVRMRGPSAVMAIVNSKWAASEPSWE